jgi:mannitol-1-/sugar-/sorbitol-6-/2-deoxyglucose-6-phosphatase
VLQWREFSIQDGELLEHVIKAVIFDMDGLIIDSEPLWREAEIEVFAHVGVILDDERCRETLGLRIDQVVDHWYRRSPWPGPSQSAVADQVIQRMIELIYQKGEPKDGLAHALSFFNERHLKVALASSSLYKVIFAVIERLKLSGVFEVIYSAEEEVYGKPHPGVYLSTAHKLGCLPQQCVALEDSLNGVIAAKAALMKCIAIPEDYPSYSRKLAIADVVVGSLADIEDDVWCEVR